MTFFQKTIFLRDIGRPLAPRKKKFGGLGGKTYPLPEEGERSFAIVISSSRAPQSAAPPPPSSPQKTSVTIISIAGGGGGGIGSDCRGRADCVGQWSRSMECLPPATRCGAVDTDGGAAEGPANAPEVSRPAQDAGARPSSLRSKRARAQRAANGERRWSDEAAPDGRTMVGPLQWPSFCA